MKAGHLRMAFLEYWTPIDRGRIRLPASYRRRAGDSVMLVAEPDGPCIMGYPSDMLAGANPEFEQVGSLTFRQRVDNRGRITIPQRLREYTGIRDVVVFVSIDDGYFELWGQVNWEIEGVIASKMSIYFDDQ